jgi:hypothetical protein
MKFFSAILPATALFATSVAAFSWNCLTDSQAWSIINEFSYELGLNGSQAAAYNASLNSIALPTYQEISDSINFLAGQPLGSITFASRAQDEYNHTLAQAIYQRETLNIWHTCNVITWRWRFTLYPGALPVQGINVFVLNNGLLQTDYIEFNSLVWFVNVGGKITPPGA